MAQYRHRRGEDEARDERTNLPPHRQPALHPGPADRAVRGRNQEARWRPPAAVSRSRPGIAQSKDDVAGQDLSLTEEVIMAAALKLGQEKLGKDDAYLQAILQGGDVDATVNALVGGTKLADPTFRKSL